MHNVLMNQNLIFISPLKNNLQGEENKTDSSKTKPVQDMGDIFKTMLDAQIKALV